MHAAEHGPDRGRVLLDLLGMTIGIGKPRRRCRESNQVGLKITDERPDLIEPAEVRRHPRTHDSRLSAPLVKIGRQGKNPDGRHAHCGHGLVNLALDPVRPERIDK